MYEEIELDSLIVQITKRCNLNCRHCFISGGSEGEMSVGQLRDIIEEGLHYNVKEISFSGGEPLTHSKMFEILELTRQYPQINFGILTNGILLTSKIMREIEEIGNIFVQISVDGSEKEIYELNRGIGTFEKFRQGLEVLASSQIKDKRTRTAVTRINYKDVKNMCLLSYEKGLTASFLFVIKSGNASENWDELDLSEIQKVHVNNVIKNFNKQYGTHTSLVHPAGGCVFSKGKERRSFNIGAKGEVSTCDFLHDIIIGNVFEDSLGSIIQGSALQEIYQ